MAKEDLLGHPLFRALVRAAESVIVAKAKPSRSLAAAVRLVGAPGEHASNPILGIFPEGTRSRGGEQLPAFPGTACIARRCGVPLVAVALTGFHDVWSPARRLPRMRRRRDLGIHILSPLNCADFADDQAMTDAAMDAIYTVVRRDRHDFARGPGAHHD